MCVANLVQNLHKLFNEDREMLMEGQNDRRMDRLKTVYHPTLKLHFMRVCEKELNMV